MKQAAIFDLSMYAVREPPGYRTRADLAWPAQLSRIRVTWSVAVVSTPVTRPIVAVRGV